MEPTSHDGRKGEEVRRGSNTHTPKVAFAAKRLSEPKIDVYGLGVAYVEDTVRLWWEPCHYRS